MTYTDVIAKTKFDYLLPNEKFTDEQKENIRKVIEQAYTFSDTARKMFDDWISQPGNSITIYFAKNEFRSGVAYEGSLYSGLLYIDPDFLDGNSYINSNGKAVPYTLLQAVIHEFGHALNGTKDTNGTRDPELIVNGEPKDYGSDYSLLTDYQGANVAFTNKIWQEITAKSNGQFNFTPAISYIATAKSNLQTVGYEYTNGTAIDNAVNVEAMLGKTPPQTNWNSSILGKSDDLLIGGSNANILTSGDGDDFLFGFGGKDTLNGGNGNDRLNGGNDDDILNGDNGDDSLEGGDGKDTLNGGNGDDVLDGGDGDDILNGSNDFLSYGSDNDILRGGYGDDTLNGGTGDDILKGERGNDLLNGGDGIDTATYSTSISNYVISPNFAPVDPLLGRQLTNWTIRYKDTSLLFSGEDGTDTLTNVEFAQFADAKYELKKSGLTFQQDFAFVIDRTGSMWPSMDSIKAQVSSLIDAIFAKGIDARFGIVTFGDTNYGEASQVVLSFTDQDSLADRKSAAIAAINSLTAGGGGDTPETPFDGLKLALDGSMGEWRYGAGTRQIVLLTDAAAKDGYLAAEVTALANNIGGSIDIDPTTSDVKISTIITGFSEDNMSYLWALSSATGGVSLIPSNSDDVAVALIDIIRPPQKIEGTSMDDLLVGTDARDLLYGFAGNDAINGGDGHDNIDGGDGNDTLYGDAGNDVIYGGDGNDTLYGDAGNDNLYGDAGNDNLNGGEANDALYGGAGSDTLYGDAGNDNLNGGEANDTLYGGIGDDIICGGMGVDLLFGGAGNDIFRFNGPTDGIDKINDFVFGSDRIEIDNTGFGGSSVVGNAGALDASMFSLGTSATTSDQRFIYNNKSGALFFDADGLGGVAQVRIAQLVGNPALTSSSIYISGDYGST
jgi:Ca2+-binding RTX toxin-like protein